MSKTSNPPIGRLSPPVVCIDKGHGRIEQRTIRTTTVLNDYLDFPHVAQAACVERVVIKKDRITTEQVYLLTDLSPDQVSPEQLLALNRGQWSIENRLHWVRDVTFDEDRCRVRKGYGPQVLAAMRNFVISLLRLAAANTKRYIPGLLRYFAAHPAQALNLVLGH